MAKNGCVSKSATAPPTPLRPNNLLEAAQARLKERQRLEEEERLKASQPCGDEYARLQHQAIEATARAERIRGFRTPEFDHANSLVSLIAARETYHANDSGLMEFAAHIALPWRSIWSLRPLSHFLGGGAGVCDPYRTSSVE